MPIALILVRWLHLSASMLPRACFLFQAVIVVPAARNPSAGIGHLLGRIHRLTCRTAFWTLLVALMSWFGWSWLVASTMSGDDLIECLRTGDWLTALTGTLFARIWFWDHPLSAGTDIRETKLFAGNSRGAFSNRLVSLAWVGHAAAGPGAFGVVHLLGDALHLLTSAFWPGVLAPLAAF
jgi:putative copper export protein